MIRPIPSPIPRRRCRVPCPQLTVGTSLAARTEDKAHTVARALAELEAGAKAVMVGDRRFDVDAARAHGVPCVGALWGIGSEAELREAGAAALVRSPGELVDWCHAASARGRDDVTRQSCAAGRSHVPACSPR